MQPRRHRSGLIHLLLQPLSLNSFSHRPGAQQPDHPARETPVGPPPLPQEFTQAFQLLPRHGAEERGVQVDDHDMDQLRGCAISLARCSQCTKTATAKGLDVEASCRFWRLVVVLDTEPQTAPTWALDAAYQPLCRSALKGANMITHCFHVRRMSESCKRPIIILSGTTCLFSFSAGFSYWLLAAAASGLSWQCQHEPKKRLKCLKIML